MSIEQNGKSGEEAALGTGASPAAEKSTHTAAGPGGHPLTLSEKRRGRRRLILEIVSGIVLAFIGAKLGTILESNDQTKKAIENRKLALAEADQSVASGQLEEIVKARTIYEHYAKEIPPDKEPLRYAEVKRKIARCFVMLSPEQDQKEYFDSAKIALESSKAAYAAGGDSWGEARATNDLAEVHLRLSDFTDSENNLVKALRYADAASIKLLRAKEQDDYVLNQITACQIHRRMAEASLDNRELPHLARALGAANLALSKLPDIKPQARRGQAMRCRGNAFLMLAQYENKLDNINKAIADYQEAAEYSTLEQDSLTFAELKSNLGAAYTYLAEVENRALNLQKALDEYDYSLEVYTPGRYPLHRAMAHGNKVAAFRLMSEVKDRLVNLNMAKDESKLALNLLPAAAYPFRVRESKRAQVASIATWPNFRKKGKITERLLSTSRELWMYSRTTAIPPGSQKSNLSSATRSGTWLPWKRSRRTYRKPGSVIALPSTFFLPSVTIRCAPN